MNTISKLSAVGLIALAALILPGRGILLAGPDSVQMCHVPPGNPGNTHSISVSPSAVEAHLAHGDSMVACGGDPIAVVASTNNTFLICDLDKELPGRKITVSTIGRVSVADHQCN